jgi:ABC-type cobalamin/Fe3+-siderophores transport system ATPase subunit
MLRENVNKLTDTIAGGKYTITINKKKLEGVEPVVILGPNGSGKTTLAVELANTNDCEYITAHRNISLSNKINLEDHGRKTDINQITVKQKTEPWNMANDFNLIARIFKQEENDVAVKFFRDHKLNPNIQQPKLRFEKVEEIWAELYPGRKIDFSTNTPIATTEYISKDPFQISKLSGGERAALYLIVRVITANESVIIVDEPELHFHSHLASKFWNILEKNMEHCRFVYVTHDLNFSMSRKNCQFVVVHSPTNIEIVDNYQTIPDSVLKDILGAASFSVAANNVLFCEGTLGNNTDFEFYSRWYTNDMVVVAVESCNRVIKCVETMKSQSLFSGLNVFGIIDRDYWPDKYFEKFENEIKPLLYHEIESFFVHEKTFKAVCESINCSDSDLNSKWDAFIARAKSSLTKIELNKLILERSKKEIEILLTPIMNAVKPNIDLSKVETDFIEKFDQSNWDFNAKEIFSATKKECTNLVEDWESFLKYVPGKLLFGQAASTIGINEKNYKNQMWAMLEQSPDPEKPHFTNWIEWLKLNMPSIP